MCVYIIFINSNKTGGGQEASRRQKTNKSAKIANIGDLDTTVLLGVSGELGLHGIFHIRKKIKTKKEFSFLSLATAPKFFFFFCKWFSMNFLLQGGPAAPSRQLGGRRSHVLRVRPPLRCCPTCCGVAG